MEVTASLIEFLKFLLQQEQYISLLDEIRQTVE